MEDLDRIPPAQRDEVVRERLVVSASDADVRTGAVRRLEVRAERVRMEARRAEAGGHALGEEPLVVGPWHEVPPGAANRAEARGNGAEQLLQARAARKPELVGVGVEDPVRAEVGRREPRHPRDPLALAEVVAGLADQVEHALARVALEDLRGRVLGAVVGRDDEVDARVQVVGDLRVDDVGLVADEERHDELHAIAGG